MKVKLSLEQIRMLRAACLLVSNQCKEQANSACNPELKARLAHRADAYMQLYKLSHTW